MRAPLSPSIRRVQFAAPLTDADHQTLARILSAHPDVMLRAYGHYGMSDLTLDFLRHYPALRAFSVELHGLADARGLEHLPESLQALGLGATQRKVVSLNVLRRFPHLNYLWLDGQSRDLPAIAELRDLEELTLRSVKMPDLALLTNLPKLWRLELKLGSTSDLRLIPRVGRLKFLELWQVRGLTELAPIQDVTPLQYLYLQSLAGVKRLPDLRRMKSLRRIHLETMKGLTDVDALAAAPALEELVVVDCPQLKPEQFRCLAGHGTLRVVRAIGLGSLRRNAAAQEIVGRPSEPWGEFEFR